MTKGGSMTRNHNDDGDASSSSGQRFKTCEQGGVVPWSDIDHDVLFLVMMQLGVVDYIAFGGVCESWRSFALCNRNMFMKSMTPMGISTKANEKDDCIYLDDVKGRRFKTIVPRPGGRIYLGSTCGYMILFGSEPRDFWLVNPITRHQLHFPNLPSYVGDDEKLIRATLVFSPISGWVFFVVNKNISYSIEGKQGWNHVFTTLRVLDLCVFKGKIYTLHTDCRLSELILDPESKWKGKWKILKTNNFIKSDKSFLRLVSSNENLYLLNWLYGPQWVMELDFGEMKWVLPKKRIEEYAFFVSYFDPIVAIKPKSWAESWTQQYKSYGHFLDTDEIQQSVLCYGGRWYFPHDILNVNHLHE